MDRRNQPVAVWGDSLHFWCRLWQIQIEHSMRFWGAWASQLPRPTAADLAAEAEAVKAIRKSAPRPARQGRAGAAKGIAGRPAATVPAAAQVH